MLHLKTSTIWKITAHRMNNLAVLVEIGEVVEKDVAKAKELYLRSLRSMKIR